MGSKKEGYWDGTFCGWVVVRGPEVGDYLALEDTWKGAACFLLHEKGFSKVWIRDRSGTEQDGLRDGFIHNKTRETGYFF